MTDAERLLQEKYLGVRTPEYEADIAQLELGMPLAYLIGYIPFFNTTIFLDSRPLIPRTETEYWVEIAINDMQKKCMIYHTGQKSWAPKVLDLFAGSGCIGVAVLKHISNAQVDFGEINSTHLTTIQKNIRENGIEESRARVIQTDVFENISGSYDYVCANPPYLSRNRMERVEQSVQKHEPNEALFAAEDGNSLINQFITELPAHLNKSGTAYLEHEPEQAEHIKKIAKNNSFQAESFKDQYGVTRYSTLAFKAH